MGLRKPAFSSWLMVVGILVLGTGGFSAPVAAQEGDIFARARAKLQEGIRRKKQEGKMDLPDPPADQAADDTPLGDAVQVIRLISHQDKADLEAGFAIKSPVMIDEDLLPPEGLADSLEETYLGKPFSEQLLADVIKGVIEAYKDSDFPLVDAYLPEQNITTGKLQIVVREALMGELKVEGAKHSNPDYLMKQIRVKPGDRINTRLLEGDIDWMNSNPSRRVDLIYERGAVDGTSDIILKTEDGSTTGSYLSFGNTGIEATGIHEWSTGASFSKFLGTEQSFAYNFTGDFDLQNLNSHVVIYEIPLPWRHRLEFLGALVLSESGEAPLDVEGESIQGSANYKISLPKLKRKMRQNLQLSVDFKSTNTDILFGGASFFDSTSVVFQLRGGYDITIPDKAGYTKIDLGGVVSPGDVLFGNDDADFAALREGSSSDYWYLTGDIERVFTLPEKWNFKLAGAGQYTDHRLISTEQMLSGGYRTVRGFDENLVRGDNGVFFSAELITPPVSFFNWGRGKAGDPEESAKSPKASATARPAAKIDDYATFFVFYDNAFLFSNDLPGFEEIDQSIQSIGLGVNYNINGKLRLRASYGWNLADDGVPGDIPSGKLHFGVTGSF